MSARSVKTKLFFILALLGAIPFIVTIAFIGWRNVIHLEQYARIDNWNKNIAIKEHLAQELDKNFYVLRSLSVAPALKQYLETRDPMMEGILKELMSNSSEVFHDPNPLAVTDDNGIQLIRTDGAPKVNISQRKPFQEAMAGHEYISDAMTNMSTGGTMMTMVVPVFNRQHKVMGLVQRNFDLDTVQSFIQTQKTEQTSIIIADRENNIISHTEDERYTKGMDVSLEVRQISEALDWGDGVIRMNLNGEDCLATLSRGQRSGWSIITITPYKYIWSDVHEAISRGIILGLLLLLLVTTIAYLIASRITRPLQEINNVVSNLASGNADIDRVHLYSDDELGDISQAINEMRNRHEILNKEAKTDKLTGLLNQMSIEEICRRKLHNYEEAVNPGLIAICIVDIDHFQKANREEGRQYGDKILQEFARGLKDTFSERDSIGRLEADEFVVVLDNQPDKETIKKKVARINEVARNIVVNGENAGLTASIGVAIAPHNGKTYNHLFHAADLALFDVKEHGRDSYKLADEMEG